MTRRRGRSSVPARVGISALYDARAMRIIFTVSLVLALAAPTFTGQASRSPVNAEEFDQLFQRVKNWGRWGAEDQLGSVNLITAAKRKQALSLAKTGQTVSLVHNPITEKAEDNNNPFEHVMQPGFNMDTYRVS